jgi:hypothetical protein
LLSNRPPPSCPVVCIMSDLPEEPFPPLLVIIISSTVQAVSIVSAFLYHPELGGALVSFSVFFVVCSPLQGAIQVRVIPPCSSCVHAEERMKKKNRRVVFNLHYRHHREFIRIFCLVTFRLHRYSAVPVCPCCRGFGLSFFLSLVSFWN